MNILDRVMFDSREAALKPEGQKVLLKVAKVLAKVPNRVVQVIGHTDHVPIRDHTPDGFTENWVLSAGRTVAAVRFLAERAGMDQKHLSAVGSGEFKPLADNLPPEGRAKNRRIAVVVLPEELVGTDLPKPKTPPAKALETPVP